MYVAVVHTDWGRNLESAMHFDMPRAMAAKLSNHSSIWPPSLNISSKLLNAVQSYKFFRMTVTLLGTFDSMIALGGRSPDQRRNDLEQTIHNLRKNN